MVLHLHVTQVSFAVTGLPGVRVIKDPVRREWLVQREAEPRYLGPEGWQHIPAPYAYQEEALHALTVFVGLGSSGVRKRRREKRALGFATKSKPSAGRCIVQGCRRQGNSRQQGLCAGHHKAAWRRNNPLLAAYDALRHSARRRRIEFGISFEYFCGLADSFGYANDRHTGLNDLTIDRVKAERGYIPGNLRVLPKAENIAKGNRERHLPEVVQRILASRRMQSAETYAAPPAEDDILF